MSLLVEIADRLRLTPRDERQKRRAIRALESRLTDLRRRVESYDLADRLIDPMERWTDGSGRLYTPLGTVNDRRAGGNRPVLFTELDLRQQRAFARLLCDTNYLAAGALNRLADFVIGDGSTWQVTLKGAKPGPVHSSPGGEVPEPVKLCQRELDTWREFASWGAGPCPGDPADVEDDPGLLQDRRREAFIRGHRDGEAFLRFFDPGEGTGYRPDLRWVEPEQVWTPPGESQSGPWSWGVLTDDEDIERRYAYWVRNVEDGGATGDEVEAWKVVHWKLNVDATVKRGLSDFFTAGDDFETVRRLLRNMNEAAAIISAIAYLRQHAPGITAEQVTTMIGQGADLTNVPRFRGGADRTTTLQYVDPGTVLDVSNGLQYVPPPLLSNIPGFVQVAQSRLRAISRKWGMPEDLISGDASNNNYASLLVAGGPFERAAKSFQQEFARLERAIAYKVLAFAVRSGRLTAEHVRAVEVHVVLPSVSIADRAGETQRRATLIREAGLSPQTALAEEGYDPAVEAANTQAWQDQFPDQSGGMFDLFGGGGGDSGGGGRAGLVKPRIIDKNGVSRIVWTRPDDRAAVAGTVAEEIGLPPFPGAVFDRSKHRWVKGTADKARRGIARIDQQAEKVLGVPYTAVKAVAKHAERAMSVAMVRTQALAKRAAQERGLPADHVERVGRVLAAADFALSFAASKGTAAVTGGNAVAGFAAGMMPTASVAYLLYSTARDPLATLRAAKAYVAGQVKLSHGEAVEPGDADALLALFAGAGDADWAEAVVVAALDATGGDVSQAVAAAEKVLSEHPTQEAGE